MITATKAGFFDFAENFVENIAKIPLWDNLSEHIDDFVGFAKNMNPIIAGLGKVFDYFSSTNKEKKTMNELVNFM